MAFEVDFRAFGDEAFAAFLAATFDTIPAGFGGHASAESVLLFTGAF